MLSGVSERSSANQAIVDENINGFAHFAIQFHHSATAKFKKLAYLHGRFSKRDRNLDRDIVDCIRPADSGTGVH